MTDSKYFTTNKKGEIFELKAELNNEKKEKRKEAVKKVIAAMTVGKDVSSLFPDVVNCMQTDNLELKKLVYLYLMNYAKSQPDMAIMAVNSFVKDCEDPNPLIRALAVRTMGCIRVDKITEYLCEPLRKCLKDEDPYVRKTAAVCVAKLHDINAQMVEDQGFLDSLRDLIADSNPMVVANAVAALSEISESHPNSNLLDLNPQNINKLLTALNECTEWGQIFILDCLSNYNPKDDREAQSICERVTPRLSHANSAVVLSAVKVLMKFLELLPKDSDYYNMLLKKLAPPLVTLLSGEPEVQYVALRNINLIVQKRPEILKQEIKVFFVKYNDPIYVKLEKLDIMIRLASQANIAQVLAELKEYATEVDVDFVRKAVRAIGRCAIKVEQSAERCVSTLLDLIQTKVNYVVQEAIVVIRDIFRKYPNKYESIIATLCENLDSLDEPDARAAMIWIVGEYAERIDNADELLESFLEGFHDESTQVQLTLLTAIVKLFLKKPSETQELVQQVLSLATQVWLPAVKAKGLEISGTFTHRQGHIYMEMNFTNKALQHMTDFAIQFNKNSFGVIPSTPLAIHTPLMPNQSIDVSLPLNTLGPVMKMEPLNNLQVAVKNNIDVFYFSCLIPLNVLFVEDGKMERQVFLATWKDIPNENELQFQIKECHLNADTVSSKLQNNNVYTIAKRNVEGQDMLYQSLKLTNGIWILAELRIQPGNPNYTLSLKCRAPEVSQYIYQVYDSILKN
ncbi:AP-2 complex subunit beta isoform X5 [Orcinus orca]|uniref:AP-2 complex subunit beta isoform X5 n=1 Tax=Orcinus orca TaxID=9733 RepID=UPI002112FB9E|nr:AP-2 complex subunit beta isoform X5 [Orcinus orca]XP_059991564.1 AP-2 complex subunit beta isoform X7 [Lagenorhynchus albirostris]